jgi:DNA-binding response OmpR family regulator
MKAIYILEDDREQLKALRLIFEKLGYKVFVFSDFIGLKNKIDDSYEIYAFILDLALKGTKNGFQAAEEIMKTKKIPSSKFIFMSGWKKQFEKIRPAIFSKNIIIDKAEWSKKQIEDILKNIDNDNIDGAVNEKE